MSAPRRKDTEEIAIPVLEIEKAKRNAKAIRQLGRRLEQDNQRILAHLSLRDKLSIGVASFLLCVAFSGTSLVMGKDGKPDIPSGGAALGTGALSVIFCRRAWNARPDRLPLASEDRLKLEKEYEGRTQKQRAFLTRNLGDALPFLTNE